MNNKNILTLDEVVSYIGFSQKQIYMLTSTRVIPHYKPSGRKLFFKKDEIDEWKQKRLEKQPYLTNPLSYSVA